MVLQTQKKLGVTEPDFPEKKNFTPKIGKMGQKHVFFLIYWKILSLIFT